MKHYAIVSLIVLALVGCESPKTSVPPKTKTAPAPESPPKLADKAEAKPAEEVTITPPAKTIFSPLSALPDISRRSILEVLGCPAGKQSETGCEVCPSAVGEPFESPTKVVWRRGSYTVKGSKEALIHVQDCPSDAGRGGAMFVLREDKPGSWSKVSEAATIVDEGLQTCLFPRRAGGAERIVCHFIGGRQGVYWHNLAEVSTKAEMRNLFSVDNEEPCSQAELVIGGLRDGDKDGADEIAVTRKALQPDWWLGEEELGEDPAADAAMACPKASLPKPEAIVLVQDGATFTRQLK